MKNVPLLSIQEVSFVPEGKKILDRVSLDIREGEIVTVTGPSGSGKSTLLKLISSILSPTEGSIFYKGTDIREIPPTEYRKKVSYFFQNAVLFGETVRDNLCFPYEIRKQQFDERKAKKFLKEVRLPENYLKKPVHELSGGEKQRVALVRNMLFMPKVLVLDEVTSSLDTENSEIILSLIKKINRQENCAVLWVTHKEKEIKEADRLIEVKNGGVKEIGIRQSTIRQ